MEPFATHTGIGVPLRRTDVDTDQIVPSQFMKRIAKTGYDDALFHSWRQDEDFILDREPYARGSILVAGVNFGTGSSREHAVWALRDFGFRVVISPRFAEIFRGNARNQGLLAAQVDAEIVDDLWDRLDGRPGMELTVDLERRQVIAGDDAWPFEIDDDARRMLMAGLDPIAVTLEHEAAIAAFERRRPAWMPTTTPLDAAG